MKRFNHVTSEAGVTLAELAVILTVLGVLAISFIPVVGTAIGDAKTRGAGKQVLSAFRRARQHAVTAGAAYTLTVNSTSISIACIDDTPAGNVCPPDRSPDTSEAVAEGVTLASLHGTFTMGATGGVTPGTVTVATPVATWMVAVNAIGGVRLCETTCP